MCGLVYIVSFLKYALFAVAALTYRKPVMQKPLY
jgi:hypothetical protein